MNRLGSPETMIGPLSPEFPPRTMPFEDYRRLCDHSTNSFRRIGIQQKSAYEAATRDDRTVFFSEGTARIPVLVPLEYEDRHDPERAASLSGTQETLLLAVPLSTVNNGILSSPENIESERLPADFSILVEHPHIENPERREEAQRRIASKLSGLDYKMRPGEFIDPRIESLEDNRTAWMGIYSFSFSSNESIDPVMTEMTAQDALVRAWEQHRNENGIDSIPDKNSNDTFLLTPEQLRDNPEIVDGLWRVSQSGFGDVLGKYHPVAMEVTRHFFDEHITSDSVLTAVRYSDGEPVCFGFVAPNMDNNDWLDCESTVLKNEIDYAKTNREQIAHFFELISSGEKGAGLSTSIIDLFVKLASRSRESWRVIFESTNLSDTYIPHIAVSRIKESPYVNMVDPVGKIGQLDYWYLVPETRGE